MKKIFFILFVSLGCIFLSCKKDSVNDPVQTDNTNPAASNFAIEATWTITNFMKNGVDQTVSYSTSKLLISPDNNFSIYNDALSANGKWLFGTLAENTLHFDLDNPDAITYDPWKDIQDVWKIDSYTPTTMVLQSADNNKMMALQKLAR